METQEQKTSPVQMENKGTKFLAGVGIAALVLAAAWLGIQAVQFGSNITNGFANAFSGITSFFDNEPEIALWADPAIVANGDTFVLSWTSDGEAEGAYVFTYSCAQGVHLTSAVSANNANVVFCNTPFSFVNATNQLTFGVVSTNENMVELELAVEFTPNDSDTATKTGQTVITVVDDPARIAEIAGTATSTEETSEEGVDETNGKDTEEETPAPITPAVTPGTPSTITTTVTPVNDPNGTPDLVVRILSVGMLDDDNYIPQTGELDPDERLAVRFEIENIGTKDTGTWNFEAKLPTEPSWTYESDDQETLLPGSRVEYTLGFDDAEDDEDTDTIRIEVDPEDDVDEVSENNNVDTVTISLKN